MAVEKWANDDVMDAALAEVATSTMLRVCSGTDNPADRAAAISATLASISLTAGDGNGDFVIADGDSGGRKVTVAQQSDVSITASGDATIVTLDDGTALQYVTTCTEQSLTSGGTVTIPAWTVTFADPS
jgi:hypothetical protein